MGKLLIMFSLLIVILLQSYAVYGQNKNDTPTIQIHEPEGETFVGGSPIPIGWVTKDDNEIKEQRVSISVDAGKSFFLIDIIHGDNNRSVTGEVDFLKKATNGMVKIEALDVAGNEGEALAVFRISPCVDIAFYSKKTLVIGGIAFSPSEDNKKVEVIINDQTIPENLIELLSNTTIILRGNKKELNLKSERGANNVLKLISNDIESNMKTVIFKSSNNP